MSLLSGTSGRLLVPAVKEIPLQGNSVAGSEKLGQYALTIGANSWGYGRSPLMLAT